MGIYALALALVVRQPVGVVACITPYNFPIVNMAGKIGPALAMGNTVVVKPAPQDPLAVIRVCDALQEVFPAGVVNLIHGGGETGLMFRRETTAAPASGIKRNRYRNGDRFDCWSAGALAGSEFESKSRSARPLR